MAVDSPDEAQEKLNGIVVRIFDACSFQDIVGQRITMVARTLKVIASRAECVFSASGKELDTELDAPGGRKKNCFMARKKKRSRLAT